MHNFCHNVLKLSHLISSKMVARTCTHSTSSYSLPHCVKTQVAFLCLDLRAKIQNLVNAKHTRVKCKLHWTEIEYRHKDIDDHYLSPSQIWRWWWKLFIHFISNIIHEPFKAFAFVLSFELQLFGYVTNWVPSYCWLSCVEILFKFVVQPHFYNSHVILQIHVDPFHYYDQQKAAHTK